MDLRHASPNMAKKRSPTQGESDHASVNYTSFAFGEQGGEGGRELRLEFIVKHVGQLALQPNQDMLEFPKRDRLLTVLQAEKGGRRQPHFPGELGIGRLPPLLPEELPKLCIQRLFHAPTF